MKVYEKPSLDIESLMAGVVVAATYADPNDYPETSNDSYEAELSDDLWGDLFGTED